MSAQDGVLGPFLSLQSNAGCAVGRDDAGEGLAVGGFDQIVFEPGRDIGVGIKDVGNEKALRAACGQVDQVEGRLLPARSPPCDNWRSWRGTLLSL